MLPIFPTYFKFAMSLLEITTFVTSVWNINYFQKIVIEGAEIGNIDFLYFFVLCKKLPKSKAAIKFSFCVVARYLTENRRFEQQNPVKIKCSQLNCDQPQKEDVIASLHSFFLPNCFSKMDISRPYIRFYKFFLLLKNVD